jgi:hypothetical protein
MNVSWKRQLVWNLSVAAMISCIAFAAARLLRLFVPTWNTDLIFFASLLAALEASYSYRAIQDRPDLYADAWKSRVAELVLLFVFIKVVGYFGDPWIAVLEDIDAWPRDLGRLFDAQTMATFVVAFLSWLASTRTAYDLDRLYEPSNLRPGQPLAAHLLIRRFFIGGVLLFLLSGIAHLGVRALFDWQRGPAAGILANVLVYFALGVFMMGQVRLATLSRSWRNLSARISPGFIGRWVRYSLVLLALAGLLAGILPTRYATRLLEAVAVLLDVLFLIISVIYMLLSLLLMIPAWLFSLLLGRSDVPPPRPAPMPMPDIAPQRQAQGLSLLEAIRTFAFWLLIAGIVAYAVWNYMRSHPDAWRVLASFAPWQWLQRLWRALRRRFGNLTTARRRGEAKQERTALGSGALGAGRRFWLGALSARERVLYHYYAVLRRAKRRGLPRRASETPAEYEHSVVRWLPQAEAELSQLTEAFTEARFSEHPVGSQEVRQARGWAHTIRRALSALEPGRRKGR